MSPTKKKTTRKKTTEKKTPTRKGGPKSAPKKAAAGKATSKKAAGRPEKAAKAAAPAKTAAKKAESKKSQAPAAKASKADSKRAAGKGKGDAGAAAKPAPKGKLVPLSEIPHPKYGLKFECFACQTKFYMMGRPEPLCPKCGADQRERPPETPKETPKPKRVPLRPMAPLLDDDDEVASARDDLDAVGAGEPDDMFDDAELDPDGDETELVDPRAAGVGVVDED